jgi:hypothetical protein
MTITEVTEELAEIVTNINHAFIEGKFDHLPDPMRERDVLVWQAIIAAKDVKAPIFDNVPEEPPDDLIVYGR